MCVIVKSVYGVYSLIGYESSDASMEILDILVGIDTAECQMRVGIHACVCVCVYNYCVHVLVIVYGRISLKV